MHHRVKLSRVMRLAGSFAACAIGSGFATGQEIMQFFTSQGLISFLGTVVTACIFAWCGATFMKHGRERCLATPDAVLAFYFGKKLGKVAAVLIQVFLYSVYVIMLAGAGATLSEFFGWPPALGRILIAAATLLTVILGLSKAADVLGGVGTIIIIFAVGIGLIGFFRNPGGLLEAESILPTLELEKVSGGWLWSSILYPGYNAIVVIFLSCCLGAGADNREEAVCGGALGGILFGLAILAMNLGLMTNLDLVGGLSVPTLALAQDIHPMVALVFSIIIFLGIYTTAVPMLWGVVRQFAEDRTRKSLFIALGLTALGLVLSITDFKKLVNIIYPFSGYAGVGLMILLAVRDILTHRKKTA